MDVNEFELNYVKIGQRIREARTEKKWNQGELAYYAGLKNAAHISHIEKGKTKVSLPTIVKIANALSVSVDWLLCDNLEQSKPVYDERIARELDDCDTAELQAFLEIIQTTKKVLRKNRKVTTIY